MQPVMMSIQVSSVFCHILCILSIQVASWLCIIQGTSSDQDNRFTDKNKRLMRTMRFADAIAKKVIFVF